MKKPYLLIITAILYLVLTGGVSLAKDSDVETIEALKKLIKIDPDLADAHFNLGNANVKSGKYQDAIDFICDIGFVRAVLPERRE